MHKTVMYHIKYMLTNSVLILFYTINNPQERSAVSTIVVAAQVFTFESYFVLFSLVLCLLVILGFLRIVYFLIFEVDAE